jgi:hypothetical protein
MNKKLQKSIHHGKVLGVDNIQEKNSIPNKG